MRGVSGVYRWHCKPTGKNYVGKARNLLRRHNDHLRDLRRRRHGNTYLQAAWNKYGEKAFEFVVIEKCPFDACLEREAYWIKRLKSSVRACGFNLCENGTDQTGLKRTAETRRKMSEAWHRHGMTEDMANAGQKISQALKGRARSEETKKRIAEAALESWASEAGEERRKLFSQGAKDRGDARVLRRKDAVAKRIATLGSEECRAKMSAAHAGKPLSPEHAEALATAIRRPEVRAKISASVAALHQDPEYRKRFLERNQSDEARKKRSEGLKRAWVRRKAAQKGGEGC